MRGHGISRVNLEHSTNWIKRAADIYIYKRERHRGSLIAIGHSADLIKRRYWLLLRGYVGKWSEELHIIQPA